jgi:hypothetical protein
VAAAHATPLVFFPQIVPLQTLPAEQLAAVVQLARQLPPGPHT